VCGDGLDNDGDGFFDCDDQDCHLECPAVDDDDDTLSDDDDAPGDDDDSAGDDDDAPGDDDSSPCVDEDSDNWCAEDDCDDQDPQTNPVAVERCDGEDNDCDGRVDEDALDASTWYADSDGDGYGGSQFVIADCVSPSGYVSNNLDCDDLAPESYPGAAEVCDGVDNNCDTVIDEDVLVLWYGDADGDGYGDPSTTQQACTQPSGTSSNPDDCNDGQAAISPSAVELCDGLDNDCDGDTDEAGAFGSTAWYSDGDGDGYGAGAPSLACNATAGQVDNDDDCDDLLVTTHPEAAELCDDIDNNCDGNADEGTPTDATTWYADLDGDGAGGTLVTQVTCSQPAGFVSLTQANDCDDLDATALPGGVEICDGTDNNCNTVVDEGVTTTFFLDSDSDGYGDPGTTQEACFLPTGYSINNLDCDDGQASAHPGGIELCDDLDNDCNNSIDDGALDAGTWYPDADGDTFGAAAGSTVACNQPSGTVSNSLDCDDSPTGAGNFPGNTETCDGTDNNCNVIIDEGFDVDGDGVTTCGVDGNSGTTDDDCNDLDGNNFPSNIESCDNQDNNCDTVADEGILGTGPLCAGLSCEAILNASNNSTNDGTYWIDPDSSGAFETWCDLNTSDGGWTLAIRGTIDGSYNGSKGSSLIDSSGFMAAFERLDFSDVLVKFSDYQQSTDYVRFSAVGNGSQTLDNKIQNCCSGTYGVNYNGSPPFTADDRSSSLSGVSEVNNLSLRQSETAGPNDGLFFVISDDRCYGSSSNRSVSANCIGAMLGWGPGFYQWSSWESYTGWDTSCSNAGYRASSNGDCTSTGAVFVR